MATATLSNSTTAQANPVVRFFTAIGTALIASAERSSRLGLVQRYQALSDDELASIGLTRDDIVRHVYSDLFYV